MRKVFLLTFLLFNGPFLFGQIFLTIEGKEFNDTETGVSFGISIPHSQPTTFAFINNSVTSVNSIGYMLQAGDEVPGYFNNNLDGATIAGNKFVWNGTDETSTTHALFTGYNLDVIIKYNYLYRTPNGIQRKSDGMTDRDGVIAYNIIYNPMVGIVVKGMNGVRIFNNTLYCEKSTTQTLRGLIDIHKNTDNGLDAVSAGTKVFNNIFYTKNSTLNIKIFETECLSGFESDYNVFWCESGEPVFEIAGQTKSFAQWQALGYDLHSVVVNPDFINFTDFVPRARLDYGKDLGPAFLSGLATDAVWSNIDPKTNIQNGTWQVGARIYQGADLSTFIYPNPAYNFFYVIIPDLEISYHIIRIYDMNGRLILTDTVSKGSNKIQIPRHLSTGMYTISLEASNMNHTTRKLIVIK
jgi:hypothetical protein